jgi:tetratricopeptide (TPR) repeat protein
MFNNQVFNTQKEIEIEIRDTKKQLSTIEESKQNYKLILLLHDKLAQLYHEQGHYDLAYASQEQILTIRKKALPINHPDLANSYNNVGGAYKANGDLAKAKTYIQKAAAVALVALPADNPHRLGIERNLRSFS